MGAGLAGKRCSGLPLTLIPTLRFGTAFGWPYIPGAVFFAEVIIMWAKIKVFDFGTIYDGQKAHLYKVERKNISFCVTDYGCSITSLKVRNKDSSFTDVVLGFETLDGYASNWGCFGAVIGRFANRINGASFKNNNVTYKLTENVEGACLHGGFPAWSNLIWSGKKVVKKNASGICFTRDFADGEQGFPGNLHVEVEYLINDDNQLTMTYRAHTDKITPLSITNHSYFNLRGKEQVHDYVLKLDSDNIVTFSGKGALIPVSGTEYDFTKERPLCDNSEGAVKPGFMNYDVCYVSNAYDKDCGIPLAGKPVVKIAELTDPVSGRKMTVSTNQEGFQLYTAKYVNHVAGKDGRWYMPYQAVCIETQSFPDSPNQPDFPPVMLKPDQQYEARTVYEFN